MHPTAALIFNPSPSGVPTQRGALSSTCSHILQEKKSKSHSSEEENQQTLNPCFEELGSGWGTLVLLQD